MTNYKCPFKSHCRSYELNHCEGCSQNLINKCLDSNYVTRRFGKSNTVGEASLKLIDASKCIRYSDAEYYEMLSAGRKNAKVSQKKPEYPIVTRVTISGPCTIIFWEDGTKTVMRCSEQDKEHFDPEKAILLAFYRKVTGFSKTHTQKELDKLTNDAYYDNFMECVKREKKNV